MPELRRGGGALTREQYIQQVVDAAPLFSDEIHAELRRIIAPALQHAERLHSRYLLADTA